MDYITYSERLDYLLELLRKGKIESPSIIAKKFDCCDKTARNMINRLREKGYQIEYSKSNHKYFIEKNS